MLYPTVTEPKQVEDGFIALVSQVAHLEEGFPPMSLLGDAQQVEDLQVTRCGGGGVGEEVWGRRCGGGGVRGGEGLGEVS